MTIGFGTMISTVDEFNRRAVKALAAAELRDGSFDEKFAADIKRLVERHGRLTEKQQLTLYQVVNRNAGRIWDQLVKDFAGSMVRQSESAPLFRSVDR